MKNEFEEMCAKQAHQQEIIDSRVGCLGGSDAAMVLKVARRGIESLSNTDIKRLRIMLGLDKQQDFGGNAATNAGHMFEDYMQDMMSDYKREKRLELGINTRNFKAIAHADYVIGKSVVECKFVQKPTEKVLQQYMPQLQWYYLFAGVDDVRLAHGWGSVEPFYVKRVDVQLIGRDLDYGALLLNGLRMIDDWCDAYLQGNQEQSKRVQDDDEVLTGLLASYHAQKTTIDTLTKGLEETKAEILAHMQANDIASGETCKAKVVYKGASTQLRLDSERVQEKYPQVVLDEECWKRIEVKPSVTIKLKEQ